MRSRCAGSVRVARTKALSSPPSPRQDPEDATARESELRGERLDGDAVLATSTAQGVVARAQEKPAGAPRLVVAAPDQRAAHTDRRQLAAGVAVIHVLRQRVASHPAAVGTAWLRVD